MRDYASRIVADGADFYSCDPLPESHFDGEILRFPSAIETPYPENNTVWGRFFDAGKDLAVVVLPQGNGNWESHVSLCRVMQRVGITCFA